MHDSYMYRVIACGCAALCVSATTVRADDEAKAAFDRIYGPRIEAAQSTGTTRDDVELAAQLLAVAQQSTGNAPILTLLCEHAAELGARDDEGYGSAIAALELLAEHVPDKAAEATERVVPLRRRMYASARGDEKIELGERLIDDYVRSAEAKLANEDASGAYRDALGIATAIKSDRRDPVNDAMMAARDRLVLLSRIDKLKAQLKARPDDAAIAKQLVMAYVVDLDDPDAARKYTFLLKDEKLVANVTAAAKSLDALTLPETRALGDWYHGLAGKSRHAAPKARLLTRARGYYDSFQTRAEKPDALVALALNDIDATLEKLGAAADAAAGAKVGGAKADLLKMIDLKKHFVGDAEVVLNEKGLHFPNKAGKQRCRAPALPRGSYELAVEVTRHRTGGHLGVVLPVGENAVSYMMGYGGSAMFAPIDGKATYSDDNPTRTKGEAEPKHKYLYKFTVKIADDQCQLKVERDGKPITEWEGPLAKVGSEQAKDAAGFGFYVNFGSATFNRAEVRMLSGRLKRLP